MPDLCFTCSKDNKDEGGKALHKEAVNQCSVLKTEDSSKPFNPRRQVFYIDHEKAIYLPHKLSQNEWRTKKPHVANFTFTPMNHEWMQSSYCITWGEQMSEKTAKDNVSAIYYFIQQVINKTEEHGDELEEIVFWADNCSSQNKNWTLFYSLLRLLHAASRPLGSVRAIQINWVVRGHTHNLCDQLHSSISKNLNRNFRTGVYTHPELLEVMRTCQKPHKNHTPKVIAKEMEFSEFYNWEKQCETVSNLAGYPGCRNLTSVRFECDEPTSMGVMLYKVTIGLKNILFMQFC
jgi:hypothetical protein